MKEIYSQIDNLKNDLIDLAGLTYKQPKQVLMAARRNLSDSEFDYVIKLIMTAIGRIFIPTNVRPAEEEWANWATGFHKHGSDYLEDFKDEIVKLLKYHYPDCSNRNEFDEKFVENLKNAHMTTNQAKHFLRIAEGLEGNPWGNYIKSNLQAEHIFPRSARNPGEWFRNGYDWDEDDLRYKNMLGNFIILEGPVNNYSLTKVRTWKIFGHNSPNKPSIIPRRCSHV